MIMRALLQKTPIMPVLVLNDIATAMAIAQTLARVGINTLEITLRTPQALDIVAALVKNCPESLIGVGTVLTVEQLQQVQDLGASFAVSPGLSTTLVAAAQRLGLPLLPGVATPSEVMRAKELGVDTLKFFPAQAAGGIAMLKALAGPFPDILFCPTGGIDESNVAAYLELANVICVGGSWLIPSRAVAQQQWSSIEQLAQRCLQQFGRC